MAELLSPQRLSDIRAFEREWIALRECVSPRTDKQQQYLTAIDWRRLLLLAREHGVLGQLAACLADRDASAIPPEIKPVLAEHRRAQNFLTLRLTGELFRLLELFNQEGIRALVIKGPVLAVEAYANPGMRGYGDLDLLVCQRDIHRATELLIRSGYQPALSLAAIRAGKIPGQYLFSKPDAKLLVELHNDLTLRYFPRALPIKDLFARQIRVRVDAHEVPAPSLEDHLVLICVHGAKHFWERLMWVADVAGLVTRETGIDWGRVADLAKALGAERMLHAGLHLATNVLGAQMPRKAQATVKADAAAARLADQVCKWLPAAGWAPPSLFQRALFRMRMRGDFISGTAYLLRLSLSPTEEDWNADPAGKRHGLLGAL